LGYGKVMKMQSKTLILLIFESLITVIMDENTIFS
jgi:hypothetical protein